MRIAAFGDIHSNSIAFECALKCAESQGMDACLLLGDYVSDCACPVKTLEIIERIKSRYPTFMIRGNREEYLLNHLLNPTDDWQYGSRTGSLLYTFDSLPRQAILSLGSLPVTETVSFPDAPPVEMVHGAFDKTRAMLLPGTQEAEDAFSRMKTPLLLCAHTHTQFTVCKNGKTIANGGPVGVPACRRTGAGFLLLESRDGRWLLKPQFCRYDVELVHREFQQSGFYRKAKYWARAVMANLRTGEDYTLNALRLVHRLSDETGRSKDDESLWARAAEILGF